MYHCTVPDCTDRQFKTRHGHKHKGSNSKAKVSEFTLCTGDNSCEHCTRFKERGKSWFIFHWVKSTLLGHFTTNLMILINGSKRTLTHVRFDPFMYDLTHLCTFWPIYVRFDPFFYTYMYVLTHLCTIWPIFFIRICTFWPILCTIWPILCTIWPIVRFGPFVRFSPFYV